MELQEFIRLALEEDIQDGDHTTLACIPSDIVGEAKLLVKEDGILAGVEIAKAVFLSLDAAATFDIKIQDGSSIKKGDIAFLVRANYHALLMGERLALNIMQRMSGIATKTNYIVNLVKDTSVKILDTRKTTPLLRFLEKKAVKLGGGYNHRFGLYDMVMIKDNHVDFAGGIKPAIQKTVAYLKENSKNLKIEIEVRNFEELQEVLEEGKVDRIMLDNFTPENIVKALRLINNKYETEASGGINEQNIVAYAQTGVDYISVGALTHGIKSLDLSLKAVVKENTSK